MKLSPAEEAYLNGEINDLQEYGKNQATSKLGSIWAKTKSTVGGWLNWGTPTEKAQGVDLDFWGNVYTPSQSVNKSVVADDRLNMKAWNDASGQSEPSCAWYSTLNPLSQCNPLTRKVTSTVSSAGDFISSTLTKVIVIMVIVGVVALFAMSYVQAKAGRLANA